MTKSNGESNVDADTLFSPTLISPSVVSALPEGYTIRPLQRADYDLGFLDVLRVLTQVGDVSQEDFGQRFDHMKAGTGGYHILVILDGEGKIVGTGALIVEVKLYDRPPPAYTGYDGGWLTHDLVYTNSARSATSRT